MSKLLVELFIKKSNFGEDMYTIQRKNFPDSKLEFEELAYMRGLENAKALLVRYKNDITKELQKKGYKTDTSYYCKLNAYGEYQISCEKEEWKDIRHVYVSSDNEGLVLKVFSKKTSDFTKNDLVKNFINEPVEVAIEYAKGYYEGIIHCYKLINGCKDNEIRVVPKGGLFKDNYNYFIIQVRKED